MPTNLNALCSQVNKTCIAHTPERVNNLFMKDVDVIGRIDARLDEIGKTWADLGRAVRASDQRTYNWRSRGIPKTALKPVATFLGWSVDKLLAGQGENGGGVGGGAAVSLPKPGDEPRTIAGLLHAMHPELDSAPRDIREAIEALVLTYQADPKEGERIAKAMKTLLQKDT